jgi:hypothetical protein
VTHESSIARLVAQCVALNTLPDASPESEHQLREYLSAPSTCDTVYALLLARARDATHTVAMVTALIATHVTTCTPSARTLHKLLAFASALDSSAALVLAAVIRAELKRTAPSPLAAVSLSSSGSHLRPVSKLPAVSVAGPSSGSGPATAAPATAVPASGVDATQAAGTAAAASVAASAAAVAEAFVGNWLRVRPRPRVTTSLPHESSPSATVFANHVSRFPANVLPTLVWYSADSFRRSVAVANTPSASPSSPISAPWLRSPASTEPPVGRLVSFGGADDDLLLAHDEPRLAVPSAPAAAAASAPASAPTPAPATTFATLPANFASTVTLKEAQPQPASVSLDFQLPLASAVVDGILSCERLFWRLPPREQSEDAIAKVRLAKREEDLASPPSPTPAAKIRPQRFDDYGRMTPHESGAAAAPSAGVGAVSDTTVDNGSRYYRDQPRIEFPEARVDELVASAADVREPLAKRTAAVRLLLRFVLSNVDTSAFEQLRSICQALLRSPRFEVRVHAFELLFNVSVHLHLVEQSAVLAFARGAVRSDPPEKRAAALRSAAERNERLAASQRRVFGVLCGMLAALAAQGENDAAVLAVALNCMLFSCLDAQSRVRTTLVHAIDVRVLLMFLSHVPELEVVVTAQLLAMLVGNLYAPLAACAGDEQLALHEAVGTFAPERVRRCVLMARIERADALDRLCELYATAASSHAVESLFCVLFDVAFARAFDGGAAAQASARHHAADEPDAGESDDELRGTILLQVLRSMNAPHNLQVVFQRTPSNFADSYVRQVLAAISPPRRDVLASPVKSGDAYAMIRAALPRPFITALVTALDQIARRGQVLAPEFAARRDVMMSRDVAASHGRAESALDVLPGADDALSADGTAMLGSVWQSWKELRKEDEAAFGDDEASAAAAAATTTTTTTAAAVPAQAAASTVAATEEAAADEASSDRPRRRSSRTKQSKAASAASPAAALAMSADSKRHRSREGAPTVAPADDKRAPPAPILKSFALLREMVQSSEAHVRREARLWLFALVRAVHEPQSRDRSMTSAVRRLTLDLCADVCASSAPLVARQFLLVVERVALWMRSRMRVNCDRDKVDVLMRFVNVQLLLFVKARRRVRHRTRERRLADSHNSRILLLLLLDLVCVPLAGAFERDGTAVDRLLRGDAAVCAFLLDLVDIVLLRMLYSELSPAEDCDNERIALFHLIAWKCQRAPGALETMPGGISFFKNLLYHRSAEVAHFAACFLLDHLLAVQPDEYRAVLAQVLKRTRTHGNADVLSDTYRQIRAIVELNAQQQQLGKIAVPSSS